MYRHPTPKVPVPSQPLEFANMSFHGKGGPADVIKVTDLEMGRLKKKHESVNPSIVSNSLGPR